MAFDEPMINHTTFGIGGPAGCLVYPDNREELSELLQYANKENIPAFFIGSGSNILVWDKGFDGFIVVSTFLRAVNLPHGGCTVPSPIKSSRFT